MTTRQTSSARPTTGPATGRARTSPVRPHPHPHPTVAASGPPGTEDRPAAPDRRAVGRVVSGGWRAGLRTSGVVAGGGRGWG